ncbi:MAG TPA: MBL fold metallo-hydrolase [Caulobacteraceae bacterium]|jgi:glyoxylase-like metal-dependent hydrolase (beta-lactamase superfamily II)|nr:MBL fold metallo-hydrolase [Caulobacteraceae bacterium]
MNLSWTIGDAKVTRIVEIPLIVPGPGLLASATRDAVKTIPWLSPHFIDDEGRLIMSIHALVVETPTKRIVVDTCIGNDKPRQIEAWSHLQTSFLKDFEAAGFSRDSIDVVLCTHLHVDHVGWNTMLVDGRWEPTFPNARYLMGRAEFEFWKGAPDSPVGAAAIFADSVQPVWDAGLIDLVASDHRVCPEVSLVPTPGHTIDHVSVRIASKGEEAVITGDFVHHPCQFAHPDWDTRVDYDGQQSSRTRERMFDAFARDGTLVIGTHFPAPTAGRVVRDAEAYRFEV